MAPGLPGRGRRRRPRVELPIPGQEHRDRVRELTTGPYDISDVTEDDTTERIDLGALKVPTIPGFELRVEVSPDGQVVSATLAGATGEMQLGAFAAPRTDGIWSEVRAEIAASLKSAGSAATERDGAFGAELVGRVPGPSGPAPARFLGIDGPRWFLRALMVGPVAIDKALAQPLEKVLRAVVVDRGADPLPVREPLPLQLPRELAEQLAAQQAAAGGEDPPAGVLDP